MIRRSWRDAILSRILPGMTRREIALVVLAALVVVTLLLVDLWALGRFSIGGAVTWQ